ncbi:MAG: RNA polymerase sigma factor [Lachnospiraceae bacterium]|nr:RNA polymerase sigma factor [Lachnospiraceae bacterium]
MKSDILEQYVERVYGYAMNHTYSREEAEELAQEILYTAVRELPKLKEEQKFEPWLWGVAGNVTKSYRRFMGKQRAMYSYDMPEDLTYEEEFSEGQEEVYDTLRTKIAMLSSLYRDIIVSYYYDGLSVKQISERLNIPEGTVTWRLSEARKKLKKECDSMKESALRPVELMICISGSGEYNGTTSPFPYTYINDALSQNILYQCYEQPKTVEELAIICGVPAYYVEDRIDNLLKREGVTEPTKGKYRTEFLIYSEKVNGYNKKAVGLFEPIVRDFVKAMRVLADGVDGLGIYTAGKQKEELIYLYGMMAMEHLSKKYNPVEWKEHPVRYDGGRWSYHAHLLNDHKCPVRGLGREQCGNRGNAGSYSHTSYHFGDFTYRKMMWANQVNVCEAILSGSEVTDAETAATAIEEGYIIRRNGTRYVAVPAFTKEQYEQFIQLVEESFATVIDAYTEAVRKYVAGYKKLFPTHLEEHVDRACNYRFLTSYGVDIYDLATEQGLLVPPSAGSVCDVLVQHK